MAFAPTSPVTGGAQTGLTAPTYTLATDTAPASHGKQYNVSALGGTQTGVEVHSLSRPFTATMFKVANPRGLPTPNPSTGVIYNIPKNDLRLLVRKGVDCAASQQPQLASIDCKISVPAGSDVADPESLRAMFSLFIGILDAHSAAIGDTAITNTL